MSFSSYVIPRTIARFETPFNRDVRVVEERGAYKLLVNGSRQSGEYIKKLWQHAFVSFGIIPSPEVKKILVLGVAGGTVIHMLHTIYPGAEIIGVDIDPQMIEIGKKYFGLSAFTLLTADAREYIKREGTWDCIVVDLFIGATIPAFVGEEPFLSNVKKRLTPGGKLIVNYLYEYEYKKLSDVFYETLTRLFGAVEDTKIYFNRFFFVVK